MIDLKNTFIKNEEGELKELFVAECEKQGIAPYSNVVLINTNKKFLEVYDGDICTTDGPEPEAKEIFLADLRKKQGKTVWDAVNYFNGNPKWDSVRDGDEVIIELYCNDGTHRGEGEELGDLVDGGKKFNSKYFSLVCTAKEFSQCVDDLANWANKPLPNTPTTPYDYEQYKNDYEMPEESRIGNLGQWSDDELKVEIETRNGDAPTKPRVKVEYVKVEGDDFVIAGLFSSERVYYMSSNSHDSQGTQYKEITNLDQLACASVVYRKVENEITWQDELLNILGNAYETANVKWLVDNEPDLLIKISHLVSSMNK